jgi:hypothetical protein
MSEDLNREIGRMKDQWRQEFRDTRAEITRLQSRLNELRQKLNNADEILAAARLRQCKSPNGKYSKMGVTDAIRSFFTEHRYTAHGISDVKRRLENEGLKTDAQDLRANISMICRRLEKDDDFLTSELRNGVRMFRLKDKSAVLKREQAGASKPAPARSNISG